MQYVTGLSCLNCGRVYPADPCRYLCPDCGDEGLLEVEYDYKKIKNDWSKEQLEADPDLSIWRYLPLLPIKETTPRPSLRIGWTPLNQSQALAEELGLARLYIKDEGVNPTASLKDRASAIAVIKAQEAGARIVACSSTGNAASSLAGNVAALGGKLQSVIFVPERVPTGKLIQLLIYGAEVISVKGSYQQAYNLSAAAIEHWGWYNRNAAINPYLVEGKKTVTLELAEQLNYQLPDWLVFSVGDGCTIAGAWKGLIDLYELNFINKLPRLLGVQAAGCAPVTRVYQSGEPLELMEENTLADSIAVGHPRNYRKAIKALKEARGEMVNVSDQEILTAMNLLGKKAGVFAEPAGAAGLAGLKKALLEGIIDPAEGVGVVITGNGLKDSKNARLAVGNPIEIEPRLDKLLKIFREKGVISC